MADIIKETKKEVTTTIIDQKKLDTLLGKIKRLHKKSLVKCAEFIKSVSETAQACNELGIVVKKGKKTLGVSSIREYVDQQTSELGFGYNQYTKYVKLHNNESLLNGFISSDDEFSLSYKDEKGDNVAVPASVDNLITCINSTNERKEPKQVNPEEIINNYLKKISALEIDNDDDKAKRESFSNSYKSSSLEIVELRAKLKQAQDNKKSARTSLEALRDNYSK